MEGLLIVLSLIVWVAGALSKAKKPKGQKTVHTVVNQPQYKAAPVQSAPSAGVQTSMFSPKPVQYGEGEGTGEGRGMERAFEAGSLNAQTYEGEDLCDPALGHDSFEAADPDSVYAGEIGRAEPLLDLSPRGLWQGVVMSEVLARPAQRRFKH